MATSFVLKVVFSYPLSDGSADIGSGIFLDEMTSGDRDFGLVFPASAEFAQLTCQNCTGFGVYEQLRQVIVRHPIGVAVCDGDDVSGRTGNRDLTRPGQ